MSETHALTLAAFGERALIDRIRARTGPVPSWVTAGIGDDAAVVEPERGRLDVFTTDSLVEEIHFRRGWTTPEAIGAKAVAVNFSDLAAMGATPRAVLLSLALPTTTPVTDFDRLLDGVIGACAAERAHLIGGNLAQSPGPMVVDVTAIGSIRRRRLMRRSGGRAGDDLYVTGTIGTAATGLAILQAGLDREGLTEELRSCLARYERPVARLRVGRMVASARAASAAIDLSDGLAAAVAQLTEACGTGASIEAAAVPIHTGALAWTAKTGQDALRFAITGGEDYELLMAVPRRRRRAFLAAVGRAGGGVACIRIGQLTKETGVFLDRDGQRDSLPDGFSHFAK